MRYDPEVAPISADWLALDEMQRIRLVESHHQALGVRLPNLTLHATIHVVVENQLAEGLGPVVRALARLTNEGLSRHDAVHAIGSMVAAHLYELMKRPDAPSAGDAQARLEAAVDRLTAESWLRSAGAD